MNKQFIRQMYRTYIEEDIILKFSEMYKISLEEAMHTYYSSSVADMVYDEEQEPLQLDCPSLIDILEQELITSCERGA